MLYFMNFFVFLGKFLKIGSWVAVFMLGSVKNDLCYIEFVTIFWAVLIFKYI